jgi:hypothetical protein
VQQEQRREGGDVRDEQARRQRTDPGHEVYEPDRDREAGEERRAVVTGRVPGRGQTEEPLGVLSLERREQHVPSGPQLRVGEAGIGGRLAGG